MSVLCFKAARLVVQPITVACPIVPQDHLGKPGPLKNVFRLSAIYVQNCVRVLALLYFQFCRRMPTSRAPYVFRLNCIFFAYEVMPDTKQAPLDPENIDPICIAIWQTKEPPFHTLIGSS